MIPSILDKGYSVAHYFTKTESLSFTEFLSKLLNKLMSQTLDGLVACFIRQSLSKVKQLVLDHNTVIGFISIAQVHKTSVSLDIKSISEYRFTGSKIIT